MKSQRNIKEFLRTITFLFLYFFCFGILLAQSYESSQQVDYQMDIHYLDSLNTLDGKGKMIYHNNSDDVLDKIVIHFYPAAYSERKTQFAKEQRKERDNTFHFSMQKSRIQRLAFKQDGVTLSQLYPQGTPDIIHVMLGKKIFPGEQDTIDFSMRYQLPEVFSRMGVLDGVHVVTQWYPKPAVYESSTWKAYPYVNTGEFYSEFGDYSIRLTLPCDMKVASSATIQEKKEIEWMLGQKVVNPLCNNGYKSIHLEMKHTHDVGMVFSKLFLVKKSSIATAGDSIHMFTYLPKVDLEVEQEAMKYSRKAMDFCIEEVGLYQYEQFSTVLAPLKAGVGMEYPGMTIIDQSLSGQTLERVIAHEVIHNWFYGMLASNERAEPYVDEGFTSFYEQAYMERSNGKRDFSGFFANDHSLFISDFLLADQYMKRDLARPCRHTHDVTTRQYYINNYVHFPQKIRHLEKYLGAHIFKKIIQKLFQWKGGKHYSFNDIERVFEEESKKDVRWFFDHYACDSLLYNYGFDKNKNGEVFLEHDAPYPIPMAYISIGLHSEKPIITEPFMGKRKINIVDSMQFLRINYNLHLDKNYKTKYFDITKNRKKAHWMGRILFNVHAPDERVLYFFPIVGYNHYDKVLVGFLIHNKSVPIKYFEFEITPMIATKQRNLAGVFDINYKRYFSRVLKEVKLGVRGRSFSYQFSPIAEVSNSYIRVSPYLHMEIGEENDLSRITLEHHCVGLFQAVVNEDNPQEWKYDYFSYRYQEIGYSYTNLRMNRELRGRVVGTLAKDNLKIEAHLSMEETIAKDIVIDGRVTGAIAPKQIENVTFAHIYSGVKASDDIWRNGMQGMYFGRTEDGGILSQQYSSDDLDVPLAKNIDFGKAAFTLEVGMRYQPIPIRPFVQVFSSLEKGNIMSGLHFQAGIDIPLIKNYIHIKFPFIVDQGLRNFYRSNNLGLKHRILFSLNIEDLSIGFLRKKIINF